ncbi:MFS transporter [Gulosibacter sp. 10]|uniref:MFS transporter n=1 Tax=Gulosibacter sp. 10 TaxID=1255570 RepID=UPI00097EE8D3|nr:MFS transporter [Gulosibacter sp. 10]SJM71777.1 MFS transporter [Gulosibacter sp. 10]
MMTYGRDSRAGAWWALIALALGGFGIGCSEFIAMGLLPEMAQSLLPDRYAASPEEANAQAGWLITVYALGVVIGAPTIAVFATRHPRRTVLVWLLAVCVLGSLATAAAPNFALALLARLVVGLPHGAYFGIASLAAASLAPPGRRGQAVALVLMGISVANVVGLPALTWAGQVAGWRIALLAIAVIFAIALVAVRLLVPPLPGDRGASFRGELRVFKEPQLWMALLIGAIGFGGFFAILTYVAPMATAVAGIDPGFVPVVLIIAGVGMTIGNVLGGRLADRSLERAMVVAFALMIASLAAMHLLASNPIGFVASLVLLAIGCTGLVPLIQMRIMDIAKEGQSLAAALNHSSLNIANAVGAALGGVVIAAGFGYLSPAVIAIGLATLGLALTLVSFRMERRRAPGA